MFHQLSLWICFLSFALSFLFLLSYRTSRAQHRQLLGQLPPSPSRLPFIGHLHLIGSLTHRSLRNLAQRRGPVMLLYFGQVPTIVVSSAAAAEAIMKTHDLAFASRPDLSVADRLFYGSRDIAFSKYGDYWRQVRRVCVLHLLSPKQVNSFQAIREEEVSLLIRRLRAASGRPANVSDMIIALLNDLFCRVAIGRKHFTEEEGGGKRLRALLAEFTAVLGAFPVRDFWPRLRWIDWLNGFDSRVSRTATEMDAFIEKVLEEHDAKNKSTSIDPRNSNSGADFVDILLSLDAVDGISLSRDGIKGIILEMFAAGIDTTFTTIEWALAELMRHPEEMKRVQEELRGAAVGSKREIINVEETVAAEGMEFLKAVIKETLRLHPPLPLLVPRESMEHTELQGYHIPKGTKVMINAWAIGRDSGSWEKPEEFWPERFLGKGDGGGLIDFKGQDFQFIPFGAGRRGCPGMGFAIAIVELALANLLYHFDWELPQEMMKGDELDMSERAGIVVHKKSSLILVAKPPEL